MSKTNIQWTDITDNIFKPAQGGFWCRKISPGCANCYSAAINEKRLFGGNGLKFTGDAPPFTFRREICEGWARQKKPKRHFVNSMTDTFGEWIFDGWILEMFDYMGHAPKQTFQVLTKRDKRMLEVCRLWCETRRLKTLPPNVWLGVSVENQEQTKRISNLLHTPAVVRFISVEPLLGPVSLPLTRLIHQAIFGGESGVDARNCHVKWIRDAMMQCDEAGTKIFVKQLGRFPVQDLSAVIPRALESSDPADIAAWEWNRHNAPLRLKDKKGGDMAEWPEDLRVREFPI